MPREIPVAEWIAEAKRLFGDNPRDYCFECPICHHIQRLGDFANIGVDPQLGYQECIGRHLRGSAKDLAQTPGKDGSKSPCDYAAYGLFSSGIVVIADNGHKVHVFPFAPRGGERTDAA